MDITIIILVLTYLIIASISDIRTKEVPDFLNYFFITLGIFIYLTKTITTGDNFYILINLVTIGVFFIIGLIMYYTKQWGGADSKLLIGLGSLIPIYPKLIIDNFSLKSSQYFSMDLFLNLLIVWTAYTLIAAIILMIKNKKQFSIEFKNIYNQKNTKKYEKLVWILAILINLISLIILKDNYQRNLILIFSGLLLLLHYLTIAIKSIEKVSLYKIISTKKLRPGDYITKELRIDKKIIFKPVVHGVNKEQVKEIQKHFKEVPVKEGVAGIPAFLIATLITLLKGNIFLYLLA